MASFSDDFTGTNGALLRLRSGWSFSGSAALQDRATISSNRAKCGGLGGASAHYGYVRDIADTQQFVEAKFLRNVATGCCLYARWTNDSNFIGVRNSGTNVELIKRVAGTITSVATVATGLAVGDTVRLELRGTTAKLFKNGTQIGAGGGYTIPDSVLQSATKVGLGGEGASGSVEVFDDMAGGGLTVALAPGDGMHPSRADSGGVSWRGRLLPADGAHAGRGDVASIAVRFALLPSDGRQVSRVKAVGVGWRGRLVAGDGLHAGRADSAMVGYRARAVLMPAGAQSAGRADASAIGLRILVSGARGRSALGGTALLLPSIGPPGTGELTRIGADDAASVVGEAFLTRIGAD